MNLDRLEVFLRIVETGSMSAASRSLHLTQPALSHSLRLLEGELGTPLFERRGRGLILTAAGRALEPQARALIDAHRRLARDVAHVAAQRYYDVRIGAIDSVATYLLPRLVEKLRRGFADLHVKLFTARTPELVRRVSAGELDAAVIACSGRPDVARARRVHPYRLEFFGRADKFAALSRARSEEDVRRFPIVEIEAMPGQPTMVRRDAPTFAIAGSLATVKALVLAGFGVGALVDFMLTRAELRLLARARLPPDPACALYLISSPRRASPIDQRLDNALVAGLRRSPTT